MFSSGFYIINILLTLLKLVTKRLICEISDSIDKCVCECERAEEFTNICEGDGIRFPWM